MSLRIGHQVLIASLELVLQLGCGPSHSDPPKHNKMASLSNAWILLRLQFHPSLLPYVIHSHPLNLLLALTLLRAQYILRQKVSLSRRWTQYSEKNSSRPTKNQRLPL